LKTEDGQKREGDEYRAIQTEQLDRAESIGTNENMDDPEIVTAKQTHSSPSHQILTKLSQHHGG